MGADVSLRDRGVPVVLVLVRADLVRHSLEGVQRFVQTLLKWSRWQKGFYRDLDFHGLLRDGADLHQGLQVLH